MTFKDEARAGALQATRNRLQAIKSNLAQNGPYHHLGLTSELEDAVLGYASGSAQTDFAAQLVTAKDEQSIIAKAISSAISQIDSTLASLEL